MKVISLINMKGGVAKTTLSVNIADFIARRLKKNVLLIDVDPQFNATQCLISGEDYYEYMLQRKDTIINIFERNAYPVTGIVTGSATVTPKSMSKIEPYSVKANFDLIPGALDLYMLEMSAGDGREFCIKNYLDFVKDKYDYVIIDTPPTPSVWMSSALLASDYYLIPTKADPISITGIDMLFSIIEQKKSRYGIRNIQCCGVVLTLAEIATIVYKNAVSNLSKSDRWKKLLYRSYLPKKTIVAREQLQQRFILDSENDVLKASLTGIVRELLAKVGDENE